jgi:hypothetical protein
MGMVRRVKFLDSGPTAGWPGEKRASESSLASTKSVPMWLFPVQIGDLQTSASTTWKCAGEFASRCSSRTAISLSTDVLAQAVCVLLECRYSSGELVSVRFSRRVCVASHPRVAVHLTREISVEADVARISFTGIPALILSVLGHRLSGLGMVNA